MSQPRFLGVEWFGRFKTTAHWALLIALVNLVGIVYGFYYYLPQFAKTPVPLWIFAPDSPLAVLWAELALLAYWLHRRAGGVGERPGVLAATLDALAFIGNVQVGLWTVYVLLVYHQDFKTFTLNLNSLLLVGHAGMVLLALPFLAGMRARHRAAPRVALAGLAIATTYYLVQDALDYFGPDFMDRGCGMRPHTVPCEPTLEIILAAVTFGLTAFSAAVLRLVAFRPR